MIFRHLYQFFIKVYFLMMIIVSSGNSVFCQPYSYKFNHLTVDEGLSHTDANCVVQDNKGYIWIATHFGINRFDGYNVKKFYNSNDRLKNSYKNRIKSLLPDSNGCIWVASEGGLQQFDSKTEKYTDYFVNGLKAEPIFVKLIKNEPGFIYNLSDGYLTCYAIKGHFLFSHKLPQPKGVKFWDMMQDSIGNIYLTSNNGAWVIDKKKHLHKLKLNDYHGSELSKIYIDSQQNLLVTSDREIFATRRIGLSNTFNVIRKYTSPVGMYVDQVCEDAKGNYWLNGKNGIICLDRNLEQLQISTYKSPGISLTSQSLTNIYIDRSQCLWVSTFGGGVNYRDLNAKKFFTFQHDKDNPNSISGNCVRSILEEPGKGLWMGTDYSGLNFYDYKSKKLFFYNTKAAVKLNDDAIKALTFDNDHNLWIGTALGIDILNPGRNRLLKLPGSAKFPLNSIETLAKDIYGNIWFGNHSNNFGVIWKDKQNNFQVKYYDEGYFIFPDDKKPEVFVSSTHGLKRLVIDNEGNILKTYHYQATSRLNSLSSDYTYPISKQNDSTYWIGTIGGGLDKLTLKRNNGYSFKSYTETMGVFNDVETLEIDKSGKVWMGGNGLLCLDPNTNKLIKYGKNDGLQGNSFKVGSSYKAANGKLYFGGINGLNYFDPAEIKPNQLSVRPILTDLLIDNKKPNYNQPDSIENSLPQIITYTKLLKLNYLQNNFVISFSAMHFGNPSKCFYRYKLIGYDKEWKFTDGKNPTAAYSNLDYSDYKFVVEATNPDGVWSTDQGTVDIIIIPPWWKSLLAKMIYISLFIGGLLWIYIYQARWYKLKREFAIRELNENKREEMHKQREDLFQQQLQFFTNISHEFRTPLTLILGPLENLINNNKDESLSSSFQLMFRNIKRMVNLINELMNFRKAADSAIKLQVRPLNISEFSKSLFMEFQDLALSKKISFKFIDRTFEASDEQKLNFFDAQIVEKILFNLLSNALKYTNTNGGVTLELFFDRSNFKPSFSAEYQLLNDNYRAEKYIYFLISDTGIGISKDSLFSIFERYYQIGNNHLGSGVGLALVKTLVQLHKGEISVYSQRNQGTEFLIGLPWGENNYTSTEILTPGNEAIVPQLERTDITIPMPPKSNTDDKLLPEKIGKYILLVDDNPELRAFLKESLERFYFIYEAKDGNEALKIAADKIPDLIISDVMMPGITGIELCKFIKDKFETSHIPFVILSAKDALVTKIEGMESGADYYFAKPLSIDLLVLTVHNIFQQGQKLKLKYTRDYLTDATELVHSEKDKEFINKLLRLIEVNIQDPNLDVDFLCNNLFISRSKLYQKIKSISDQSIGDFIKTIRLKKAIEMMTHEVIPLNEVAYRIGFQSPAYFSRVFKKEFGKSPTEYMQTLKRNPAATDNDQDI
ncbi:hybrid sensor histidine kinase/response regulator transcription factor [Mucilaginibacter sp. UYCu711]|uniref:hybrid sensor histidine kinase/response regulator transcription factor n=1 Tax=Mucilaginibacter sp. UYCu711 TaxID=3156339 RepID=UPI003D1C5DDD